jgi:hypothetical protein
MPQSRAAVAERWRSSIVELARDSLCVAFAR